MKKVINIPYTIIDSGIDYGEIVIDKKRVFSFISESNDFPGYLTLYNWHELCSVTKVYFLSVSDVKESIVGIALYESSLMIQIFVKKYCKSIQVSTPCPKWLLDKYMNDKD